MEIVNLQQNTEEWLKNRKAIIGASEVSAIMDVSPWSTPYKVWLDKMSDEVSSDGSSWLFEKGHRLEDIARAKLELITGYELPPLVVKHPDLEYCQASLDGCDLDAKRQVEIKFMGKDAWQALKENKTIPEHYNLQVQYQLMATGFEYSYFCAINDNEEITFTKVFPDADLIKDITLHTMNFYNNHMLKKVGPELSAKDIMQVKAEKLKNALVSIRKVEEQLKPLTEQKKALRGEIEALMVHPRMEHDGIKITLSVTKAGKKTLSVRF